MDVIFMPKHMTWQKLKLSHIISMIMHFHTGNMCCVVVLTVHVSIFLTKKQIIIIQTQHPQYGFTFITVLHVVLLMVEFHCKTKIYDFHNSFYISYIQRLAFHLPHMCILGTNHSGELQRTAFKRRGLFQDVLCCHDYAECNE